MIGFSFPSVWSQSAVKIMPHLKSWDRHNSPSNVPDPQPEKRGIFAEKWMAKISM
jgi:hypothetical protein